MSQHISDQREFFNTFISVNHSNCSVTGVGGVTLSVLGRGNILVETSTDKKTRPGVLKDVLYVPDLNANLFSIGIATENGTEVHFVDYKALSSNHGVLNMIGSRGLKGLFT